MKKLFVLLISLVFLTTSSLAQSKRKIKKQAKELQKHLDNLDLEIVTRDLDFSKVFVVKNKLGMGGLTILSDPRLEEATWNTALFKNGIDVGSYSEEKQVKDGNNREMTLSESIVVRGDYLMEIYRDRVKISDVKNDNKLVGTLTFYLNTIKYREQIIEHIVEELIKEAK
tara:strand:+ start:38 stop:547 length:510 start_codon:yes stop_codon:yes gene_type:complete